MERSQNATDALEFTKPKRKGKVMKIETLRERIEKKQAQIERKQNTIQKKERISRKGCNMKYEAKLWLNKRQYLAVLDKALVIVTTDESGKPVRWVIFNTHEGNPY